MTTQEDNIILFDGVCNLCNGFVQFIIKRDKKNLYKFAALQSETGLHVKKTFGLSPTIDTVVLISKGKAYVKSDAVLNIAKQLGGILGILYFFNFLPLQFRDQIYDFVARNRYNWFGQKASCMVPTQELKSRFLQ